MLKPNFKLNELKLTTSKSQEDIYHTMIKVVFVVWTRFIKYGLQLQRTNGGTNSTLF